MNTRTGEIISFEEAELLRAKMGASAAIPIDIPITTKQQRLRKVGRNEPCPCGSGKKFKRCHQLWAVNN